MQRLITKQNAQRNENFLYNIRFWKGKKKQKHFKSVGSRWKVISSIAKITKNQTINLQI